MGVRRRDVLCLVLASLPGRLAGQVPPAAKVYRIGWLSASTVDGPLWEAFVEGMRERGWIENKNLAFERLTSGGRGERFPALVTLLVQRKVDVIVAAGTPPAVAARDGTMTIPIVFYFVGDPVGSGLVDSLARPGRNLTGTGGLAAGLYVKQLEILKEAVSNASRIAMFINDDFPLHAASRAEIETAARRLGVTLVPIQVKAPRGPGRGVHGDRSRPDRRAADPGSGVYRGRPRARCQAGARPAHARHRRVRHRDRGRAFDVVFGPPDRRLAPSSPLRRSHPQGRETRGPPRRTANPVLPRHQSEDGCRDRSRRSAGAAGSGGPGDSMK